MSDKLTGCFVNEPVLLDKPAPDFSPEKQGIKKTFLAKRKVCQFKNNHFY